MFDDNDDRRVIDDNGDDFIFAMKAFEKHLP